MNVSGFNEIDIKAPASKTSLAWAFSIPKDSASVAMMKENSPICPKPAVTYKPVRKGYLNADTTAKEAIDFPTMMVRTQMRTAKVV